MLMVVSGKFFNSKMDDVNKEVFEAKGSSTINKREVFKRWMKLHRWLYRFLREWNPDQALRNFRLSLTRGEGMEFQHIGCSTWWLRWGVVLWSCLELKSKQGITRRWYSEGYKAAFHRVVHWLFSMLTHLLSMGLSVIMSDGRILCKFNRGNKLKDLTQ